MKIFEKLGKKLNIIILHFYYIYAILQADVFYITLRIHQICFSSGLRPELRWESLIYQSIYVAYIRLYATPHSRRLRHLTLS